MKKIFLIILTAAMITGCNKFDNKLTDPNYPATETADLDLYLNYVQLGFADFYSNTGQERAEPGLSENGEELTRMEYMGARTYIVAYGPGSFDDAWRDAYEKVFKNVNALLPLAGKSG